MVNVTDVLDEWHVDDTEEERKTIQSMLDDADAVICDSSCTDKQKERMRADPMYPRIQKGLAYRMYLNRGFSDGMSNVLKNWMFKLQIKYGRDDDE